MNQEKLKYKDMYLIYEALKYYYETLQDPEMAELMKILSYEDIEEIKRAYLDLGNRFRNIIKKHEEEEIY